MAHKKKSSKQAQQRKRPPPLSDAEARQLAPGHMSAAQAAAERRRFGTVAELRQRVAALKKRLKAAKRAEGTRRIRAKQKPKRV